MKTLLTLIIGFTLIFNSYGGAGNETTSAPGEPLVNVSYHVSTETFVRNLKQLAPPKSGESNQDLLLRFLKENKVEIQKPAAVLLLEKKGRVLAHMTQADQHKIELLVMKVMN